MLAGVAQSAGARVHALLETDPVARDVLRARFPRALLCATVDEVPTLPGCEETSVIITATVASAIAASSTAAQVSGPEVAAAVWSILARNHCLGTRQRPGGEAA